jgi:hypothetical protein
MGGENIEVWNPSAPANPPGELPSLLLNYSPPDRCLAASSGSGNSLGGIE